VGTFSLGAQEAKPSPKVGESARPVAKRSADASRRVPPFFGQLGLTDEQRESIYKIRGKHQEKLDALAKQVAEVQDAMMAECEAVLEDGQRQMLEARRKAPRPARKPRESAKVGKDSAKSSS